jgi:uncharacterized cupredoxin-like copper-binding protein
MNVRRIPIVILLAGSLALGACGGDDDGDETSAPASSGGETVRLAATEFKFTPSNPSVKAGEVTFDVSNDGSVDHALEVEGPSGEAETDTIAPGESATLTVDLGKSGTYEMYCPIGNHRAQGMEGTVKVAGGSGGASEDESSGGSGGY